MGNQAGKGGTVPNLDCTADVRTREAIAGWHRYGVSVWDVYDLEEELGQGSMGSVNQVRRKERGAHTAATRQKSASSMSDSASDRSEPPKAAAKSPKLGPKRILKKTKKSLSGGVARMVGMSKEADEELDVDAPPTITLSEPPKNPSQPKPILKPSNYGNPTNEIPDFDDDSEDEEESMKRWKERSKDRVEHIAGHRSVVLGDQGPALDSANVKPEDPFLASNKVAFKRHYACKLVLISLVKEGQMEDMINEIYIMRTLDHPYILKLYEIYQVKRKLWMITELCTGGDLTSRRLNEPEVVVVLEQILRALAYMHRRGVMHRDLKLENILYENKKPLATIRLIDFGLSKTYDRAEISRKAIGTAYTLCPEIASKTGTYSTKSDIWSLGVCAWVLLAGDFPFIRTVADLDDKFKLNRLINAKFKFGITWSGRGISKYARHFVDQCFKKDPNDRWTAKEALDFLENSWIPAMQEAHKDDMDKDAEEALNQTIVGQRQHSDSIDINMKDIQRFCTYGRLKKTVLLTMAQTMDRNDIGQLKELFLQADTEDTGTLNLDELRNAVVKLEPNLSDKEIEDLFKGIDQDESGEIHYMEFLAALAESQGLVTMERLAEAFDRIDTEGKGYISHEDLKMVLGKDYDKNAVDRMIEEADFKKNGQVDYEELLKLMFEDPSKGTEAAGNVAESLRSLDGFKDLTTKFHAMTTAEE